jgi:cobalt-zinc-cadmium efflux system outer membrane protein
MVITLAEAQRYALSSNPVLSAQRQEEAVALGKLRQVSAFALNPEFEMSPDAELSPSARGGSRIGKRELALTQRIEWAGQRGLRVGAAEQNLERAHGAIANAERKTWAEVTQAFYRAYAASQQLKLAQELLASNEQLLEVVRSQHSEGSVSGLEAGLAEIEYARARGLSLSALRGVRAAEIELKRLTGIGPAQAVILVDQFPPFAEPDGLPLDSLLQVALDRRPDLRAQGADYRQAELLHALAAREAIPALQLSALAAVSPDGGDPWFGFAVGFEVPVWNRNGGEVDARAALVQRSAFELEASVLAVRSEVVEAHGAYLAASEEERVYEEQVLEPARETRQRLETAFMAGKMNLTAVLLVRNQLLKAESGYWEAWLAKREALVRIESATAASITND